VKPTAAAVSLSRQLVAVVAESLEKSTRRLSN
jgi:hypothetical protein